MIRRLFSSAKSSGEYAKVKLISSSNVSKDTRLFTFTTPPSLPPSLPLTSCIRVRLQGDVERAYTPTREDSETFDLLVKRYPRGKATSHFFDLKNGDTVDVAGPFRKFEFDCKRHREIVMVAAGTGITPMAQLLRADVGHNFCASSSGSASAKGAQSKGEEDVEAVDGARYTLIYANRTEDDILLRDELQHLAILQPPRLSLHLSLDSAPPNWSGNEGTITQEYLASLLPKPPAAGEVSPIVLVCGPPGFMDAVCGNKVSPQEQGPITGMLGNLGWTNDSVYKF